jgi:uncharacterized protein (DUF983 family)
MLTKCPHCHVKLGNYLYADACPHCGEELKHNTAPLLPPVAKATGPRSLPVRAFLRVVRFIES